MKELVDGGGHPDGEVDPPLVVLDRVCCTFLLGLCADRLSLDEGRTLAIWIKDRGNELGLAGSLSPLLSVCALIATQCCLGLAQASSTYSNLESADMDSLYVVLLKTNAKAYGIEM